MSDQKIPAGKRLSLGTEDALRKRVKELDCLQLIEQQLGAGEQVDNDTLLQQIVEIIPGAWLHSASTIAGIRLNEQIYQSGAMDRCLALQRAIIQLNGTTYGTLEVGYTDLFEEADEGPFLAEERRLLETIARRLGRFFERVRMQNASAEHMAFFSSIFDGIEDPIYVADPESYELIFANQAFMQLWGEVAIGGKCHRVIQNRDQPCPFCSNDKIFGDNLGKTHVWEFQNEITKEWYRCSDKAIRWPDGRMVRLELAVNITERKWAEDQAEAAHLLLQNVLDAIPVRVFWKDLNLCYLGCNKPFSEDAGRSSPADLIGKDDYQMGWLEQAELYRKDDRAVIESGVPKINFKEPQTTPNGKSITLRTSKIPLKDAEGQIMGILGTYEDITEWESLEAQLRQAQKMESIGRLAGGLAHDFNNMLSAIIGHTELALAKLDPSQRIFNNLQQVHTAAQRSADLVRQLLAFARQQTIAPRVIDLNSTVAGMLDMLRRLIGEDIELIWLPADEIAPIKADPAQIVQIMANLCVNARDAIADIGKVTIEIANVSLDQAYCNLHAGFKPGDYVLLTVSDNGFGMDAETLSQIFEPFFTTKEQGKGTGLGLAMVYGALKQNGGFINVYSEPGQGTTFKIYFPQHQGDLSPGTSAAATAAPVMGSGETILLVEDDSAVLGTTTMMLEDLGYIVMGAGTPAEALLLARENVDRIDLLLTDVVMPEMNGRELAATLCAAYPTMKTLFMSGYTAKVIAHHGVLEEGFPFVQKPFSFNDLSVKLREALAQE
jgi:signal transduction histidine kinase/ActR/RegA family two-component response regulator